MHPLLVVYECLWFLCAFLGLPFLVKKKREWLYRRWFWSESELMCDCQDCIWIHALSLGELFSVWNLPKILKEELKGVRIFLSIGTQKAFEYLTKNPHPWVDGFAPMPLDFYPSIARLYSKIRPNILLIVESDIWPFLIWYLKKKSVPVIVVNGRISPRTFQNYKRFRQLLRILFKPIDKWLVQSNWDERRLVGSGIIESERVKITGNLKFDTNWDEILSPKDKWLRELGLTLQDKVFVAGSTHSGEEEIVVEALIKLRQRHELKAIISPRDIARAKEIYELIKSFGLKAALRSSGVNEDWDVMVLDTLGELRQIYGVGMAAFVGGSLVPFGGHNLLEPAAHGLPVLFGPHTFNFVEISELLIRAGGGILVRDLHEMVLTLDELLKDPAKRASLGKTAKNVAYSQKGSLMRVVGIIKEELKVVGKDLGA